MHDTCIPVNELGYRVYVQFGTLDRLLLFTSMNYSAMCLQKTELEGGELTILMIAREYIYS